MAYIYIASPYTIGDQAENVRRSLLYADRLVSEGHIPVCPLLFHFWHYLSPKPYSVWLSLSSSLLVTCDAVHRLQGVSKGSDLEVALAKEYGIPVYVVPLNEG